MAHAETKNRMSSAQQQRGGAPGREEFLEWENMPHLFRPTVKTGAGCFREYTEPPGRPSNQLARVKDENVPGLGNEWAERIDQEHHTLTRFGVRNPRQ